MSAGSHFMLRREHKLSKVGNYFNIPLLPNNRNLLKEPNVAAFIQVGVVLLTRAVQRVTYYFDGSQ